MENSTKLLGGIAYIVMMAFSLFGVWFMPFGIINLAAAICVAVAFVQAGKQLSRPDVKSNIITAVVLYIVSLILLMITLGAGMAAMMAMGPHGLFALGAGAIVGGIIAWILAIIGMWFWYKASRTVGDATGTNLFKVGGLLLFIGAIALVLFGIGGIVMLVGEILQCIAFFTTPERKAAPSVGAVG